MVQSDSKLSYLFSDPFLAVSHFLPSLLRPAHATDLQWNNHLFGLTAIICDYFSIINKKPIHFFIQEVKSVLLQQGLIRNFDKKELKQEIKLAKQLKHEQKQTNDNTKTSSTQGMQPEEKKKQDEGDVIMVYRKKEVIKGEDKKSDEEKAT